MTRKNWRNFAGYDGPGAQSTRKRAFDEAMRAADARKAREVRETAETLVEDRGRANALAWAEHCAVRDPVGGFWRAVWIAIDEAGR